MHCSFQLFSFRFRLGVQVGRLMSRDAWIRLILPSVCMVNSLWRCLHGCTYRTYTCRADSSWQMLSLYPLQSSYLPDQSTSHSIYFLCVSLYLILYRLAYLPAILPQISLENGVGAGGLMYWFFNFQRILLDDIWLRKRRGVRTGPIFKVTGAFHV